MFSTLPIESFQSFTHGPPQRFAQSLRITVETIFFDSAASAALGRTSVILPGKPYLQAPCPIEQLMPSCSSSATTVHSRSLNASISFSRNAWTLGGSLFHEARLTA